MNERIAQYRQRLTQFWGQMGKKQKIGLGASIAALLLTIVILTYIFTRTDYEVAFQNLDTTDAAAIMTYLDGNGIPYQLSADGKSISVPSAVATRTKVDVGSQGLVENGSIGFEAFEGSSAFGDTDNVFNVKYRNALNGEVQQLLNRMQGVQSSKVLINLPEDSAFLSAEEKEQASASIMMNFTSGYRPSQQEVDGYYNLVKTAVPKLAIQDITISSPQGELVSSEIDGNKIGAATDAAETHFLIQRKYEAEVKKNIQQFLSPMIGDNLVVSVASSFNFDKKVSEENLVRPLENNNNNGIIVSEQQDNSTTTNGTANAGGVAGTGETDVPGYTATDNTNGSSEQNSRVTNYDYDRINNQIESAPYQLKDLSISIGVEQDKLTDQSKLELTNFLTSLVRAQLADSGQNVNDDVLMAKKVTILGQSFATADAGTSVSGLSTQWAIGLGAAALALIGGLTAMLVRRRRKLAEEKAAAEAAALLEQQTKPEFPTIDFETVNNDSQARKNLETLAKRKPEEFVNLLRTWLVEE
ncbi:flagellar basal-body MS-ring/collar protein FliF [Paenibacillus glycanilyticus]|uniref:Flagellar M-ring protein n=1 Tax=Paenibacillus glycanilyticus TaxID=126569 RepID=A0ABQ6GGL3_9BACL|nr:flagellar basal-body MS-ring/collar protein FliF [Paenibacillus glycanilyticus]GLX68478.1 flagellar M-ring protein [Paenibacillus glycanilyticus]